MPALLLRLLRRLHFVLPRWAASRSCTQRKLLHCRPSHMQPMQSSQSDPGTKVYALCMTIAAAARIGGSSHSMIWHSALCRRRYDDGAVGAGTG